MNVMTLTYFACPHKITTPVLELSVKYAGQASIYQLGVGCPNYPITAGEMFN